MLVNVTRKKTLAPSVQICSTLFQQARGLICSKPRTLVFTYPQAQHVSLHMIGVFFAIDVLVLDSKKRIIEIKRDFKPLQFYTTKRAGLYLVEIPAGNLGPTRVGDQLAFPTV